MKKYIPEGADFHNMAGCEATAPGRVIMEAVRVRRGEGGRAGEERPQRNDIDITQDVIFNIGYVRALTWILSLPGRAREEIEKFSDGEL